MSQINLQKMGPTYIPYNPVQT
uniref:Uncharacterized protein n=1 Tax=Anguilla anguilla TaxID=7936 RepID=A0A0E9XJF1_ANGAN